MEQRYDKYLYAKMYMGQMCLQMPAIAHYAASKPQQKFFAGETLPLNQNTFWIFLKHGKLKLCVRKIDGSLFTYTYTYLGCCIKWSETVMLPSLFDTPVIICEENAIISTFSRHEFFDLVAKDQAVFNEVMDFSTFFSHLLRERLFIVGCLSSGMRLLTWLDRLCECYPEREDGSVTISCNLTQQQIADLLFIHISTCNKLFASLEKDHIAIYTRKTIIIQNRDKIKQIISKESII